MITNQNFSTIPSFEYITHITPLEFEYFSKHLLNYLGFEKVFVTKKYGTYKSDRGIDVIAQKNNEKILVQCKKILKGHNGFLAQSTIRELAGCMMRDKIQKGIVITTLKITPVNKIEAAKMNIRLIGKDEIITEMKKINPNFTEYSTVTEPKKWITRMLYWKSRKLQHI